MEKEERHQAPGHLASETTNKHINCKSTFCDLGSFPLEAGVSRHQSLKSIKWDGEY